MTEPITEIVVSDLHIGSTVSVCPPRVNLDDGGTYSASPGQRWLWRNWQEMIERVQGIEGRKILVVNGDAVEFDVKARTNQLITHNKADILRIADLVLEPMLKVVDSVEFIRGTEAHTGLCAEMEEALAANYLEGDGVHTVWLRQVEINGTRVETSHHASMGGLPWTQRNAAVRLAAITLLNYAERKERPPDLVLRGHVHRWSDSYDNYQVRAITLPAWTLKTAYTNRLNVSSIAEIGGLIVRYTAGGYEVEKVRFEPVRRKWEVR
jgi:hypothetical protein